jgi:hypothetical protein
VYRLAAAGCPAHPNEGETYEVIPMPFVIVSRHAATVEWIKKVLPTTAEVPVLASATAEEVTGRIVIGNVPLHLAASATQVWAVEFTGAAPRGAEYTLADMEAAGAHIQPSTPGELHDLLMAESERWQAVVLQAGLQPAAVLE